MKNEKSVLSDLKWAAADAAARSYSPYSGFRAGAAVLGENGRVYSGCNVENASFGLTQCAERAALTAAVREGARPGSLVLLVLYTPGLKAHSPCGACRQVMHELMKPDSRVVSCCDSDETHTWSAKQYLPDPFTPESLKQ